MTIVPRLLFAIFVMLHGVVHLLYAGQSRRLFELRPGMTWPDDSWTLSKLFGADITRTLAAIAYVLAAIGFVAGGIGLLLGPAWGRLLVAGAAAFSSLSVLLFWDGKMQKLADQGLVALIINAAIVAAVLIPQWPSPE